MSTLQTCSIAGLEDQFNSGDIRRDLHVFVQDAAERIIKRTHRDNSLPKSVAMRLAKKMSVSNLTEDVKEGGGSVWIDYVDKLALKLGLVTYDTKGAYAGWNSSQPSFRDNYVEVCAVKYQKFLKAPLAEQEKRMLDCLVDDFECSNNEFFRSSLVESPFGWLDSFDMFGCATGVVPEINFAAARRRLLGILATCEPGAWYSTASLIAWMKDNDPYFLIPNQLRKGKCYENFRESPRGEYKRTSVKESDPLGFEKVEGRFIERFLERIPLSLGYVETAYDESLLEGPTTPSMGALKAFRITQIGHVALSGAIPEAQITILPNHEIHVAGLFHAERIHRKLETIAKLKTSGPHSVYKLNQRLITQAAADTVSALEVLSELTDQIPANIKTELRNWESRGDVCTLYCGFGLTEGSEAKRLVPYGATEIAADLVLATSAEECYRQLELMECVPQRIKHGTDALTALASKAPSRFAGKEETAAPAREEKPATIYRSTEVNLRFESAELFDAFCNALLEAHMAVALNRKKLTATFPGSQEAQVQKALELVIKRHNAKVQEL